MTVVGELFVNLGIKGAEKTVGALGGVEKSLKGLGSMSLEAKAAIIGAMYALEQLFSRSGAAGTNLTNFNAVTGASVKTLQQYQYAARQVGVSNDETANSFKSLQSTMSKLKLGEGAPKGFGQVAMLTGGITTTDVDKFIKQPELLLQRLQQYAQKEKRVGIRNEVLKSFGISDNMIAALSRNAFKPQTLKNAPTYSDKEIGALDKANIAWSNLGNKIEMAIGHFNAMHGGELVKDLSLITDNVLKLAEAFIKLAETVKLFTGINKAFEGLTMITKGITGAVQSPKKREELESDVGEFFKDYLPSVLGEAIDGITGVKEENKESKAPNTPSLPSEKKETATDKIGNFFSKQVGNLFKPITNDIFVESSAPTAKVSNPNVVKVPQITERIKSEKNASEKIRSERTSEKIKSERSSISEKIRSEKNKETFKHTLVKEPTASNIRLVVPPSPLLPSTPNITPNVAAPVASAGNKTQTFNVNQNLSFAHEGKNSKQTSDSVKKAVQDAFRQLSSQVQGS